MKEKTKWNDYDALPLIWMLRIFSISWGFPEPVPMSWYTHRGFQQCAAAD